MTEWVSEQTLRKKERKKERKKGRKEKKASKPASKQASKQARKKRRTHALGRKECMKEGLPGRSQQESARMMHWPVVTSRTLRKCMPRKGAA